MRPLARARVVGYALARLGPNSDVRQVEKVAAQLWEETVAALQGAADADLLEALVHGLRQEISAAAVEQRAQRGRRSP